MKIHLLDPGLQHAGGHHFDWDARIANYLADSGHQVSVYVHLQADEDALSGFGKDVRVERLFRLSPYIETEKFDPICGEIERQLVGSLLTSQDLKTLDAADLWLWPTGFAYQLRSCAMLGAGPDLSVCLHTPPDMGMHAVGAEPGEWWRLAAKSLRNAGRRVRTIGSLNADGLSSFLPFVGFLNPVVLPVAIDGTEAAHPELKTIGFFGAQSRDEQGAEFLVPLIQQCLAAGFKVVTQAKDVIPDRLKAHPGLTMLGSEGSFPEKVQSCDLVVAPYDWSKYIGRGSATLWQAMASGVPCVAPRDASMSRDLARTGSASLFSELNVASVFNAIMHAKENFPELAAAAFRGAQEWRAQNGLEKFVAAMIDGQSSGPAR